MQGRSTARTVLLEMARDEARAERIRSVKDQRKAQDPTFTWERISREVGVSERSVHAWKDTGSIRRDNAEKLAQVLGVDPTWLWLGRNEEDAPDLLDTLTGAGPSHQADEMLTEIRRNRLEIQTQNELLEQHRLLLKEQTALLEELREERNVLKAVQKVLEALEAQTKPLQIEQTTEPANAEDPQTEDRRRRDRRDDGTRRTG